MRIYLIFSIVFLLLVFGCNGISKNPAPPPSKEVKQKYSFLIGQWTTYQVRRYVKDSPETSPRNLSEAIIKISIVGKETVKDKNYSWVEYLINERTEQQRAVKFMIDDEGSPQPIKIIIKHGKLEPVEIELRRWETRTRLTSDTLFHEMTREFNIIPFTKKTDSAKPESDEIQINLEGKETSLKCQRVIMGNSEAELKGYAWYTPLIPLTGLVKAFFIEDEYRTSITLTAYGNNGGKSVITENTKKLDLYE